MQEDLFQTPNDIRLGVVGLGYVGLPLAVAFGRVFPTVGFDISDTRIRALRDGLDATQEVSRQQLADSSLLSFTTSSAELKSCNVYIVTVPTPVDRHRIPDLSPLRSASRAIGEVLAHGDVVIYESTVYPGATEEDCVPVLEAVSGLAFNRDFFAGYSPERINPGDKSRPFESIVKVTSGSTPSTAAFVDGLYGRVVKAGTHLAPSIRVAEASKVIENTQRDVNIALVNEMAILFGKLGIDTHDVLEAAGTKWNFLPFKPGLVGGHCIGVDPYYLSYKARGVGFHPEMIIAGRRINDEMGGYVAELTIKAMLERRLHVAASRVLVLGMTFKENCPDTRNTRVVDVIASLQDFGAQIDVWDPWIEDVAQVDGHGAQVLSRAPAAGLYDAMVLAVPHQQFLEIGASGIRSFGKQGSVVVDVKSVLPRGDVEVRL